MGCDIHGVIEVKRGSKWDTMNIIDDSRNYRVFAALAGVRNYHDITPISEPRGYPEDFDEKRAEEILDTLGDYPGDHSFSWLGLREILEWDGWDQILTYDNGETRTLRAACRQFLDWAKWAEKRYNEYDLYEVRIVFGFDS